MQVIIHSGITTKPQAFELSNEKVKFLMQFVNYLADDVINENAENSFLRNFKKLPQSIKNEVFDLADKIQTGYNCENLHYNWANFYACHFGRKPEYRLIYTRYKCLIKNNETLICEFDDIEHTKKELLNCNGLIEFVLIDTRENFNKLYKLSKKDVKNYRR